MIYKEGKGALVTPISTKRLREYANIFRTSLKPKTEKFPVLLFLEIILPQLFDNFSFHPVGKEKMGQNHGLTYPSKGKILIRTDVYEGACKDNGRDRFTIMHEIAHLLLHRNIPASYARTTSEGHPCYMDAEWQADTLAAEILMPVDIVLDCSCAQELSYRCGVSLQAAEIRMKKIHKEFCKNKGFARTNPLKYKN